MIIVIYLLSVCVTLVVGVRIWKKNNAFPWGFVNKLDDLLTDGDHDIKDCECACLIIGLMILWVIAIPIYYLVLSPVYIVGWLNKAYLYLTAKD
jgi:hypothetical protein